jgi:hypothetical protein
LLTEQLKLGEITDSRGRKTKKPTRLLAMSAVVSFESVT